MDDDELKLREVFHPYAVPKFNEVKNKPAQFVHYTSAEGAYRILKSEEFWLRNSYCLNDYSEIFHGEKCLRETMKNETGQRFRSALDAITPGLRTELDELITSWLPSIKAETYVGCFSINVGEINRSGKLSMWQAYGKNYGVALVLNKSIFISETVALRAYTSPVLYADQIRFGQELNRISENIEKNLPLLQSRPKEEIFSRLFNMLRFSLVCTKAEAFAHEEEWRVVYTLPLDLSPIIKKEAELIGGTPQVVAKIPLKNSLEHGLTGLAIPELLEEIIIGPSANQFAVGDAFIHLLNSYGVENAHDKVRISNIPLRT